MYLQLAWRNIWRNSRRTAIILIAVVIGVWSMIILGSLMRGIAVGMVKNGIATLIGHIQIHQKGYRNDPAIENSIMDPSAVNNVLHRVLADRAQWTERVRVNAVASNAHQSTAVTLVGIDPEPEANISFIGTAVTRGHFLTADDRNGILVGDALLDKLETKLGRKLVLMSQDTDQEIASRAFRIVGTFQAEMESTEKQFVFVLRQTSQKMLKMDKGISEISILLPETSDIQKVYEQLISALPSEHLEVHSWQELMPFQTAYLRILDGFMYIWYLVVFVAMGFGIVNTTLMAVYERMREFGLLKALGMKPWWILREVLTESLLLLITGMIIGNILGFLTIYALSSSGIDLSALAAGVEYAGMTRVIYPAINIKDIAVANLVVMLLGLLVSVYPAVKAARFTPVEALIHT
ncbi:Lipoprotein release ABC-type transport system, LolE-like permease protein [Olavius sp. associated proteobacterium Delta 1]|nr:Lipoprotein release ABC-type transport system, LolE-like permease protein [Olavius sp. associated proteobacterium Delta 1]